MGLYRNASARTNRLIKGLGESLQNRTMEWVVLFATRDRETFLRSCHNQLLKAGNNIENNFDAFKKTVNFTYADPDKLKKNIKNLRTKQKVTIIDIPYEKIIDANDPTTLLWNFLKAAIPEQAGLLQSQMNSKESITNTMSKKINKGLNQRGLELAIKAQPLFSNSKEWKMFRKFLEKNFSNS